jgi:uncharacterized protein (DUF58 family)
MRGGAWWFALVVMLLLAAILRQGALAALALGLMIAGGASELWARYCLAEVSYRRHLSAGHLIYGEETTLSVEFANAKMLPLAWLMVYDEFPVKVELLTGKMQAASVHGRGWLTNLVSLKWYERVTREYRIRGAQRGRYAFGPAEIVSGDIFGARQQRRPQDQIDWLVVYPKVVPVEALGLPAGRPMGEWLARRRIMEDPLRFAMTREYRSGDNPRHIHWKATARTGTLQTKQFDASDTLAITLAVDVQTSAGAYEYHPDWLEFVITAAASVATRALEERHMVGLCANDIGEDGSLWMHVPPDRRPQQLERVMTTLAGIRSLRGLPFAHMVHTLMTHLPFGGTVVAISAMPGEDTFLALADLQRMGHPVVLLTVGDACPDVPGNLTSYHLGGTDDWQHLEALELA